MKKKKKMVWSSNSIAVQRIEQKFTEAQAQSFKLLTSLSYAGITTYVRETSDHKN